MIITQEKLNEKMRLLKDEWMGLKIQIENQEVDIRDKRLRMSEINGIMGELKNMEKEIQEEEKKNKDVKK